MKNPFHNNLSSFSFETLFFQVYNFLRQMGNQVTCESHNFLLL